MGQALILLGGVSWVLILLTLAGYSAVLFRARQTQAALVAFGCTVMLATLGVVCLQNAPYWAATWVWN